MATDPNWVSDLEELKRMVGRGNRFASPDAAKSTAVLANRRRIAESANAAGYANTLGGLSPEALKNNGLSRVVKTGDGAYTNEPGATGDTRYYNALGFRADRPAMTRRGSVPVAEFNAEEARAPATSMGATLESGRNSQRILAQRAAERAAAQAQAVPPEVRVQMAQEAKLLADARASDAKSQQGGVKLELATQKGVREAQAFENDARDKNSTKMAAYIEKYGPDLGPRIAKAQGIDPRLTETGAANEAAMAAELEAMVSDGDPYIARAMRGQFNPFDETAQIAPENIGRTAPQDFNIVPDDSLIGDVSDIFGERHYAVTYPSSDPDLAPPQKTIDAATARKLNRQRRGYE